MRRIIIALLIASFAPAPYCQAQDYQNGKMKKQASKGHKQHKQQKYNVDAASQEKIDQIRREAQLEIEHLQRIHNVEASKAESDAAQDIVALPRYRRGRGRHHGRGGKHHIHAGPSAYGGTVAGRSRVDQQALNSIREEEAANRQKYDSTFQREKRKIEDAAEERINALLRDAKAR